MHPVIRLVSFLVFAAFVSQANGAALILGAALLVLVLWRTAGAGLRQGARMLARLRWLFLSLLVVYLWFTPGTPLPLWPGQVGLPTMEGLQEGVLRTLALVLLVMAANILVSSTGREGLLAALYWLGRPLAVLGIGPERFAVRLVLVMEAVEALREPLAHARTQRAEGGRLARIGVVAAELFRQTIGRAEAAPCGTRSLPCLVAPAALQWSYPLVLGLAFLMVR